MSTQNRSNSEFPTFKFEAKIILPFKVAIVAIDEQKKKRNKKKKKEPFEF
jgi:hypothetical protein